MNTQRSTPRSGNGQKKSTKPLSRGWKSLLKTFKAHATSTGERKVFSDALAQRQLGTFLEHLGSR